MQFIYTVVVLKRECVGSLVAILELLVVAGLTVEWLEEVTHIVDEQAKSVGLSDILIVVKLVHQKGVKVVRLVGGALLARKPSGDIVQGNRQILFPVVDFIIVFTSLFNPRVLKEVEVGLPHLAVIFEVISEGCTLDESMLVLILNERRVVLA